MPWVRWPPWARSRPRMVSPGESRAAITAALACAPECGATLACSAPNRAFTRSIASCSITSTCSHAVVAPARVALGVLVGEHRALRGEDGRGCEVLAGDHLQRPLLAGGL